MEQPGKKTTINPHKGGRPSGSKVTDAAFLGDTYDQPIRTLGDLIGFEVLMMLAMLALGMFALVPGSNGLLRVLDYGFYVRALLVVYAWGVVFNLLDMSSRIRRKTPAQGAPTERGYRYAVLNFLFDTAFVTGAIIINQQDENSIVLIMMMLTAARFLAHVAGRTSRLVLLPGILPILFYVLQFLGTPDGLSLYTPGGQPAGAGFIEALLVVTFVLMSYAIFSIINQRIAEEATLTRAIADRDQKIRESEISAEQDAKRLAEQVLRLDLLQDCIRAINSTIELDQLLQMVVNNAVRVLKAEQSSIGLVDDQTGELVIQCVTGIDAAELRRRRFQPGVGVAGWVAQKGIPLGVGDVREDTRYVDPNNDEAWGRTTRSILCVPLIAERKVIGTLCVTHSQANTLTEDDQVLLTSFAEQAALAVHKSKLLDERTRQGEELRRRGDLIASLHTIGQSVLSSLDLPQVLDTIISRISELSSFEQGLIYLLNERTGQAELAATDGLIEHSEKVALVEGTPAMELWKQARATNTSQMLQDSVCLLCLPLINRGKPIGCILLARDGANPFNAVERDTAEKLVDAATIAIVNARLFSRASVQQQQTAALYRLMLKVNAASNRRQLAQIICSELQQILGAKASALLIHDSEHAKIGGWACYGDWLGYDIASISLPAQGDPFVSSVLTALHQTETPGLVVIPNAPPEARQLFNSVSCVTIPLAQGGRIYGLLVIEPGHSPAIPEDIQETASLAVSHSTVALERAELFEQTLTAARQSSMLYSIAAEVQTSLDPAIVVDMTVNGALEALPIQSCELYIFDDDHKELRRVGMASAPRIKEAYEGKDSLLRGPDTLSLDTDPTLVEVLRAPGMVEEQMTMDDGRWTIGPELAKDSEQSSIVHRPSSEAERLSVVMGRLMGSEEALGILRLTTTLPADEFIHRHATFCQTLLTHSGGALERSRLYTTMANQSLMLRQRTEQLTDILNLGILSAVDAPLPALMPQIASHIARSSLQFAYVRVGRFDQDSGDTEVWASMEDVWPGNSDSSQRALSLETLRYLMKVGRPTESNIRGAYLNEALLAEHVPGQPKPRKGSVPRQLILMPLESINGGTLGYIMVAFNPATGSLDPTKHDFLEVLSIFAHRISLIIESHIVYNELLDSKRKIEAVVLSISDGVIVTDADSKVLISNSLADQLMGAPASVTQGQPLESLISNDDLINLLKQCVDDSKSSGMDVDLGLGRDQRTYAAVAHPMTAPEEALERSNVPTFQRSNVLGAVLTLRDVTAERATERAKSDFLSIVSHELRTPLNSVMGFLDIILMGKTGALNDLQTDFLGTAKQEAAVLQRLINDLLDYSQLQSGMLRLEMAPLNLSSVIARVTNQAIPRMHQDELTLTNNVPEGLLVIGDEIRLEQVFKNLLDNAAKFTDPGGEIRFDVGSRMRDEGVEADEGDPVGAQWSEAKSRAPLPTPYSPTLHDRIIISVADSGCGIPPAQAADVFGRFFQAENVASRPKRGLGLGLAICKSIVESHGGKIWLESEQGVGTTVHVELLLFKPDSNLYNFDLKTGKATLNNSLEAVSADR